MTARPSTSSTQRLRKTWWHTPTTQGCSLARWPTMGMVQCARPRSLMPRIKVMQAMRQKVAAEVSATPTHDSFFPERPEASAAARGWVQRRQVV